MMGPVNFAPKPSNRARVSEIKQWVMDTFQLPEEATVLVTELRCSEPGCPPLETVIAILNERTPTVQVTIHSPLELVTEADVKRLAPSPQSDPRR